MTFSLKCCAENGKILQVVNNRNQEFGFGQLTKLKNNIRTSLFSSTKAIPKLGIALKMATKD